MTYLITICRKQTRTFPILINERLGDDNRPEFLSLFISESVSDFGLWKLLDWVTAFLWDNFRDSFVILRDSFVTEWHNWTFGSLWCDDRAGWKSGLHYPSQVNRGEKSFWKARNLALGNSQPLIKCQISCTGKKSGLVLMVCYSVVCYPGTKTRPEILLFLPFFPILQGKVD